MTPHIFWTASLSDGQTIFEDKGDYAITQGELSPWQRLMAFLRENPEVKITSLSLYTFDNRRFNLSSSGRNPKFKIFADAEQPVGYRFFRVAGMDFDMSGKREKEETFAVVEAVYKSGKKLQLWVADDNIDNCWSLIV
jgi:hypothetical protein